MRGGVADPSLNVYTSPVAASEQRGGAPDNQVYMSPMKSSSVVNTNLTVAPGLNISDKVGTWETNINIWLQVLTVKMKHDHSIVYFCIHFSMLCSSVY